MPYFVGTEIPTICWRQHEFNVEALDGRIEKIDDNLPCYVVAHHPNKNWTYNVGIIKRATTLEGYKEIERLGRKKNDDKPSLYYELVPAEHYKNYLKKCDFEDHEMSIEQEPVPEDQVIKSNPKPVTIELPKIPEPEDDFYKEDPSTETTEVKVEEAITNKPKTTEWNDSPKLVGESQVPIYKYTKPTNK